MMDWTTWQSLPAGIFEQPPQDAARQLIGSLLLFNGQGGIIAETEAYDPTDPASHSYRGCTPGNRAMFGPPGQSYVYRSYGVHWCLNFVCGPRDYGAAVLIRALEPLIGIDEMMRRRSTNQIRLLCAGPGRLTQALGIDQRHDALALDQTPFLLRCPLTQPSILIGPRIGITKAVEQPWRFGLAGSKYLSRPFPKDQQRPSPVDNTPTPPALTSSSV